MPKFNIGDKVRRINDDNCDRMVVGSEWIVNRIEHDGRGMYLEDYTGWCMVRNFKLVESAIKAHPCIREIPAQAARTEVKCGGLTGKFYINAVDKGQIQLVKTECSGTWWNACELRSNAAAFIALADALDKIAKENK